MRLNWTASRYAAAIILAAIFVLGAHSRQAWALEDIVIDVPDGDPDMIAAIKKAQETLPQFWGRLAAPKAGEEDFALKVSISDGRGKEAFWATDIERKDDAIYATIGNEAETVINVQKGDRVKINPPQILDWMYMRNGKIVGNETMRPLLKRMTKEQAAEYQAMLETP